MIAYMCGIIVHYFSFVENFVGLDYVIAVTVVVSAFAFVYKLCHVKTL